MLYHCIHSCNAPSKDYWCVCSPRYRLRLHCNERRLSVFDTSDILLSLLKYLISFFECLTSRLGYQRCDFPLWYTDALNNEILKMIFDTWNWWTSLWPHWQAVSPEKKIKREWISNVSKWDGHLAGGRDGALVCGVVEKWQHLLQRPPWWS